MSRHGETALTDARRLLLPAQADTLAALRLVRPLAEAAEAGVTIDASGVESIGLAALQLLALMRQAAPGLILAQPSHACLAAIRDAGLGPALLDEAAAPVAETSRTMVVRPGDAALDLGAEPVDALAALRRAGVGVEAMLPDGASDPRTIEPDRLRIAFRLHVPQGLDEAAMAEPLAALAIDAAPVAADALMPAPPPVPAERIEAPDMPILAAERVVALAEELAMGQARLAAHIDPADRMAAAELVALDRVSGALQEQAVALLLAPAARLLRPLMGDAPVDGAETAMERRAAARLLPPLLALRARVPTPVARLGVREAAGTVRLELDWPGVGRTDPAELTAVVGAMGGAVEGRADLLVLALPRTRWSLLALLVESGKQTFALPVTSIVQILQAEGIIPAGGDGNALLPFRGGYIPFLPIAPLLGTGGTAAAVAIVVEIGGRQVALGVDRVLDQRQIVVQPLQPNLPRVRTLCGAAIDPGGAVMFVLDLDGLVGAD